MKTIYECEFCGKQSEDRAVIEACEAQGLEDPTVMIGDFVTTDAPDYGRFGWFDGDEKWTTPKPSGLHGSGRGFQCSLIYVVTHIDHIDSFGHGAHRVRYHVETKGMSAEKGYRAGYTFDEGHYKLRKIAKPKTIRRKDAADLIGHKANFLV